MLDRIAVGTPTTAGSVALNRLRLAITLLAVVCLLSAPGSEAHAQTTVPSAPTGLAVSSETHDSVTLTWDDPGDSSITGYQVLRRSRDGDEYEDGEGAAEFEVIVNDTGPSATTYTDATVTPRTRYVYRVKLRNSAGLSEWSGYLNVETPDLPPPAVPAAPTTIAASLITHNSLWLSWNDLNQSQGGMCIWLVVRSGMRVKQEPLCS